ncbi:MAG: hypothetical protein AB8H12_02990 [Lewinella sp.]
MKILAPLFLLFVLFACASPNTMGKQPVAIQPNATFIIGYTGGWGGGAAYKLEDGQLYTSVEKRGLGGPDAIAGVAFQPLDSSTGLAAMRDLAKRYSPKTFTEVAPKFDCREQAHDGVCPYIIVVKDDTSNAWTMSEVDKDPAFVAYMKDVQEALTKM